MRETLRTEPEPGEQLSLDALERDYRALELDAERLATISFDVEQLAGQQPSLDEAEQGLARFRDSLDELISSGLLDRPAAAILSPASTTTLRSFSQWAAIVPLAAAISMLLALSLVKTVANRQRRGFALGVPDATPSTDSSGDVLSNPYWPMSPGQRPQNTLIKLD